MTRAPMRGRARFLALVAAFTFGSLFVGWWTVPLVGFGWGWLVGPFARAGTVGAGGAAVSWALLLAWTAARGPVLRLADQVGSVLGLPGWALVIAALGFAAVLGGAAATMGASLRPSRAGRASLGAGGA